MFSLLMLRLSQSECECRTNELVGEGIICVHFIDILINSILADFDDLIFQLLNNNYIDNRIRRSSIIYYSTTNYLIIDYSEY